jgi:hypothetical protein
MHRGVQGRYYGTYSHKSMREVVNVYPPNQGADVSNTPDNLSNLGFTITTVSMDNQNA